MSDRDKRIVIGLVALFIGVLALVATLLLLIAPLGCLGESDGGLDRNSVLCDAERGQWWRVAQVGLVVIAWAGLVVGTTRALRVTGVVIDLERKGRKSRPLPPGSYALRVIALPRRSTSREQAKAQLLKVAPEVTILPAGG